MKENKRTGVVVKVLDNYRLVINLGKENNISLGEKFLVYFLSEEDIIDPETNESLGKLEYVVGQGIVIHIQEKMSIIASCQEKVENKKTITKSSGNVFASKHEEVIEPKVTRLPFDYPKVGQKVRKI